MYNVNLYWVYLPLKMKTLGCLETPESDHPVPQRRFAEGGLLQEQSCENLKPSKSGLISHFLIHKKKRKMLFLK